MTFDPFGDFETRGYLRNKFAEKDPAIIKRLEHSSFLEGVAEAFNYLASIRHPSYKDVLHTHKILFEDLYPWAGQDRAQTAPDVAVSKGPVLFAHPQDARAAVEHALKIGSDQPYMASHPGEVMGYLAYGHPFLDGNGRTIMVIHAELARRAGISIDWAATAKDDYLTALTQEIDDPGAGRLDAYLKPFLREAMAESSLVDHLVKTRGLEGRWAADDNLVLGQVSEPALQARYEQQKLQRRKRRDSAP